MVLLTEKGKIERNQSADKHQDYLILTLTYLLHIKCKSDRQFHI